MSLVRLSSTEFGIGICYKYTGEVFVYSLITPRKRLSFYYTGHLYKSSKERLYEETCALRRSL